MLKLLSPLTFAVLAAFPTPALGADYRHPLIGVEYSVHVTEGGRGAQSRARAITVRSRDGVFFLSHKELSAEGYSLDRKALHRAQPPGPRLTYAYGERAAAWQLVLLTRRLSMRGKKPAAIEFANAAVENRRRAARLRALVVARRAAEALKPQPDPETLKNLDEAEWHVSEVTRWTGFAEEALAKDSSERYWKAHGYLDMADYQRAMAERKLR